MVAPDAPGGNLWLHTPWMPPPRLPKFSWELGDGPVEDFMAEAKHTIAAYDLEGQLAVELLLKHLDGQACHEVLAQAPAARAIAGDILGLLREVFGAQQHALVAEPCHHPLPPGAMLVPTLVGGDRSLYHVRVANLTDEDIVLQGWTPAAALHAVDSVDSVRCLTNSACWCPRANATDPPWP